MEADRKAFEDMTKWHFTSEPLRTFRQLEMKLELFGSTSPLVNGRTGPHPAPQHSLAMVHTGVPSDCLLSQDAGQCSIGSLRFKLSAFDVSPLLLGLMLTQVVQHGGLTVE